MKKIKLLLVSSLLTCFSANAQLLWEDFETVDELPQEGWTVKDDTKGSWVASGVSRNEYWRIGKGDGTIAGKRYGTVGGFSPTNKNEQWLITPDVALQGGDNYKLDFIWYGSYTYAITNGQYDFQVKVQESGSDTWTQIYSITSKEDLEKSGIKWPWSNWTKYQPVIDLTAYAGKTIKVAFVWIKKADGYAANIIDIDNILIDKYTPITKPHIESSISQYKFSSVYIGTKKYSEVITIKNTGVGTLNITGVKGLDGTDFSTNIIPANVAVKPQETTTFQVIYNPTKTGAASATLTLETNGDNNLDIKLSATKVLIEDGYSYEGFESNVFPPLGWSKTGSSWNQYKTVGLSGDKCVYGVISMDETSELVTPRLDLSEDKEHFITFDFIEQFDATDLVDIPQNYFRVSLSIDGGATWSQVLENENFNNLIRQKISLGNPKSDNCLVKWIYYTQEISWDDVPETSIVYLDDVILPRLYGAASAPVAVTPVSPVDQSVDISNRNLILEWNGAQFATNYKIYLGTSATDFSILNGTDCAEATSYAAPRLECSTTYYWKVVPSNSYGSASDVPVWSFTTMADQSIRNYPYKEGFDSDKFPLGWVAQADNNTKWSITKVSPYEGTGSAFANGRNNNTTATLTTPEFVLPNEDSQISFFWGNSAPVSLDKNELGTVTNTTTVENNIDAIYFEINDGENGWKALRMLSDETNAYWFRESVSLNDYKGKVVTFRWRYLMKNGIKSNGACVDNVKVETTNDQCFAYFNKSNWEAGEVNYEKSVSTKNNKYAIVNGGGYPLQIANISFKTSNFTTTLAAGNEIAANNGISFNITYAAGTTPGAVADEMVVTFTDGKSIKLPLSAITLASDIHYYSFEEDAFGALTPSGLVTVDKDCLSSYRSSVIKFPNAGGAFAYVVINVTPECADWRNVYPHSGDQVLAAFASPDGNVNDWIISNQMKATSDSKFRFFGKSYGTTDEFNDFKPHYYSIWVSTTDNNPSSFENVNGPIELAYDANGKFTEYTTDLSKYAGKDVYVALQHTSTTGGYVAFLDDFYYEHFDKAAGVEGVTTNSNSISIYPNPVMNEMYISSDNVESVTISSLAGTIVKKVEGENAINVSDLSAGIYIVTIKTIDAVKTVKIVKK